VLLLLLQLMMMMMTLLLLLMGMLLMLMLMIVQHAIIHAGAIACGDHRVIILDDAVAAGVRQ